MLRNEQIENMRQVVDTNLPHTCTVLRRGVIGETPYEEPIYGDWEPNGEPVPCHFWVQERVGSGERSDEHRTTLAYEYRLKVPVDTDITEADTVDDVTDQFGKPMQMTQLRVTAIWKRTTETVCVLEKVRS
jgi:hypothetical protein